VFYEQKSGVSERFTLIGWPLLERPKLKKRGHIKTARGLLNCRTEFSSSRTLGALQLDRLPAMGWRSRHLSIFSAAARKLFKASHKAIG
jgi:hypothetical protein